jgi:hypothetical protein
MPKKKREIILTNNISPVTGELECVDCTNSKLNGWSSHCKTCGMPIVY